MSTLLVKLVGNRTFNRTIFPPYLYVYDDLLIYRKRSLFKVKETTISYNQVAQVNLIKGIFFAQIDIVTTGTDDITIKYAPKGLADRAKKVMDRKLYHAIAKHKPEEKKTSDEVLSFEKAISRLQELRNKDAISKTEYEKRKKMYLNKMGKE